MRLEKPNRIIWYKTFTQQITYSKIAFIWIYLKKMVHRSCINSSAETIKNTTVSSPFSWSVQNPSLATGTDTLR